MSKIKRIDEQFLLVESDGFAKNTKVHLADGTDLTPCVREIEWSVKAGQLSRLRLEMLPARVMLKFIGYQPLIEALERAGFEVRTKPEATMGEASLTSPELAEDV